MKNKRGIICVARSCMNNIKEKLSFLSLIFAFAYPFCCWSVIFSPCMSCSTRVFFMCNVCKGFLWCFIHRISNKNMQDMTIIITNNNNSSKNSVQHGHTFIRTWIKEKWALIHLYFILSNKTMCVCVYSVHNSCPSVFMWHVTKTKTWKQELRQATRRIQVPA